MKELYGKKWYSIAELSKTLDIPVSFISSKCERLELFDFSNNRLGTLKPSLDFGSMAKFARVQYAYRHEWRKRHIPETEIDKIKKLYANKRTPEKLSALRVAKVLRLYEALTDKEKFEFVTQTSGLMTVPIYNYEEENHNYEQKDNN